MHPKHKEKIIELLGEYLSKKLNNSWYKYESREKQLAYMLGLLTALVVDSSENDNKVINKLRDYLDK